MSQAAKKHRLWGRMVRNRWLYLMLAPGVIYFFIFKYVPMLGIAVAFQNYQPFLGFTGSEWVGLKHFHRLFNEPTFLQLFTNTITLFVLQIIFFFPVPIFLSLLLNEIRHQVYKRTIQSLIYVPHFFSWVIVVSLTYMLLTTEGGIVNELIKYFGGESINFLMSEAWFRPLYILQINWKEAGWGTIIYLAAMAGVDPGLYEAARIDGANRFRQIWHITIPSIRSVIVILLILRVGDVLDLSFDHIFLMMNSFNRSVADVFDTYVYYTGIQQGQFSYSAAVGVFKSGVGLVMVLFANWIAKKMGQEGLY